MIEIRFHGRGGQGSVTAAELVAQAAINEGKYAQAFPSFGPERRGAPVSAFLRVSDSQIFLREKIEAPDVIVVLDASLIELVDVFSGLKAGGSAVMNCPPHKRKSLMPWNESYRLVTVDATQAAMNNIGLPIANTAMIGALLKGMGLIKLDSFQMPLQTRFGRLAEKNFQSMTQAFHDAQIAEPSGEAPLSSPAQELDFSGIIEKEALMAWKSLALGGDILEPGNSARFLTGTWRMTGKPVFHSDACTKCGLCRLFCPEDAIFRDADEQFIYNEDYCKGCGQCARECPKGAITMEEEAWV